MKEKNVLTARYEDLLTDYDNEVKRLVGFFKLDGSSPDVKKVMTLIVWCSGGQRTPFL
jgi:hypothetical protein